MTTPPGNDVSQRGLDTQTPAQRQGPQAQVGESSASTSGHGGNTRSSQAPNPCSPSHVDQQTMTPEGPRPNVTSSPLVPLTNSSNQPSEISHFHPPHAPLPSSSARSTPPTLSNTSQTHRSDQPPPRRSSTFSPSSAPGGQDGGRSYFPVGANSRQDAMSGEGSARSTRAGTKDVSTPDRNRQTPNMESDHPTNKGGSAEPLNEETKQSSASMSDDGGASRTYQAPDSSPLPHATKRTSTAPRSAPSSYTPTPKPTPPSQPRDPGPLPPGSTPTKPHATSSTRGSTQPCVQHPPAAPISSGQDDGHARLPIGTVLQQDSTNETSARPESDCPPVRREFADNDAEAKERALQCWNEDPNFLAKDKITEWLSGQKPINEAALRYYLHHFDFTGLRLDEAFRQLCKKLYLKAETQQVDRILDVFGKRYWDCNPGSDFGNAGIAHVVSYSLLLLNTDLHVAESTRRMSRDQFVHNTMDAIQMHLRPKAPVGDLNGVEDNPKTNDSTSNPTATRPPPLETLSNEADPNNLPPRADLFPRANASSSIPNSQESTLEVPAPIMLDEKRRHRLERTLKDIYNATKSEQIELDSAGITPPPAPSPDEALLDAQKPVGFAHILAQTTPGENTSDTQQRVESHQTISGSGVIADEELVLHGPPWVKEGILSHRSYKESPEKGTKLETWMDVFAVVQEDELLMFKFGDHGAESEDSVGNGKWWGKAQPVGRLQLVHSIAQARPPPGYAKQRPNCMALTLADGRVYFFQAGTDELMNEWVSTCNYWAARRSKEPLAGGDSNMEYGWNRAVSNSESGDATIDSASVKSDAGRSMLSLRNRGQPRIVIYDWKPPISSTVASKRDEGDQLKAMEDHASSLGEKLEVHFKLLHLMIGLHQFHPADALKAQDNWKKRANYLQAEVFKYRLYTESLRSALDLRLGKQQTPGQATAVGGPDPAAPPGGTGSSAGVAV